MAPSPRWRGGPLTDYVAPEVAVLHNCYAAVQRLCTLPHSARWAGAWGHGWAGLVMGLWICEVAVAIACSSLSAPCQAVPPRPTLPRPPYTAPAPALPACRAACRRARDCAFLTHAAALAAGDSAGGPLFHGADLLRLAGQLLPGVCTDELAVSMGVPACMYKSILKLTIVSAGQPVLDGSCTGHSLDLQRQPRMSGALHASCWGVQPASSHRPTTRLQGPRRCLVITAAVSALVQWACTQKARAAGNLVAGSTPFARACSDLCDALSCPEAAAIARSGLSPTLEQIGEVQYSLTAVSMVPALSNARWGQQQPEPTAAALRVRMAHALAIRHCANLRCPHPAGGGAKKCSRCRVLRYCCTDCQRTDWQEGGHRQTCPLLCQGSS